MNQLVTTARALIADQQQPQLKALDNALTLAGTANSAVQANILVLPPDLRSPYQFSYGSFSSLNKPQQTQPD